MLFVDDRRWRLRVLFVLLSFFIAPYICTAQYLVKKQMLYSSFILIYFVVNSYIVNKTLKCTGAQPPEIKHHRTETKGLRKRRPGVSITDTHLRSLHQENLRVLVSERWEW